MPKVVVLTGAGISAESGLPTFRAVDGLWEGHKVEDVASPVAFWNNPELVHNFYNARRRHVQEVTFNPAHFALAEMERRNDGEFTIITQNVDDLHERAGSRNIIHMHGEILKKLHIETGEVSECREDLSGTEFRPHIVWFGEAIMEQERIFEALAGVELFISIGTSGHVSPANTFVNLAKKEGARTVHFNLEPSRNRDFAENYLGKASDELPKFIDKYLRARGR